MSGVAHKLQVRYRLRNVQDGRGIPSLYLCAWNVLCNNEIKPLMKIIQKTLQTPPATLISLLPREILKSIDENVDVVPGH